MVFGGAMFVLAVTDGLAGFVVAVAVAGVGLGAAAILPVKLTR